LKYLKVDSNEVVDEVKEANNQMFYPF